MTLDELRRLTPREIAKMTEPQARSAYSDLRRGFGKQLKRLEGAGYSRQITSGSLPKLSQIPKGDVKSALSEMAYWSRQSQYSLSEINKRTRGVKKWMQKHGFKNVTDASARRFGEFMGRMRDSGITLESKPKRYTSMIDAARQEYNAQNNFDDLFDMFNEYSQLVDAGIDVSGFQDGQIYGIDISEAIKHKKSILKYSSILQEFANDPNFKKPRTSKDVENLIRRARRESNKRGKR